MVGRGAVWLLLVVGASTAQADPDPDATCAQSSTRVTRWVTSDGQATACFGEQDGADETCFAFSPTSPPKRVPSPELAAAVNELRELDGVPSVCMRGKCKPPGPKLAEAVAKVRAEPPRSLGTVGILADGKALAVLRNVDGGNVVTVWSIADDRLLPLRPPKGSKGALIDAEIAGGALVASWADCAGPCARATLVDSRGRNRGTWFGGGRAIALARNRLVILPTEDDGMLSVLDTATAKRIGKFKLHDGSGDDTTGARFDDRTIVGAWRGEDGWVLQFIAVRGGTVKLGAKYVVPRCEP